MGFWAKAYELIKTKRWLTGIVATAILIFGSYFGLCYYIVYSCIRIKRLPCVETAPTPINFGFDAEELLFHSHEPGIQIHGWLLPSSGDSAIILIHGFESFSWDCSQPDIARAYVDAGFDVLVFDLRAHGLSGGRYIGLGWHERDDVHAAIDLLLDRGVRPGRIGLHGVSYGAAVALLSAAVVPEVGAVVADSAFADIRGLMDSEIENITGIPSVLVRKVFRQGIGIVAKYVFSLDFDLIAPEVVIPNIAPRPILLIHGSLDPRIPVEHSRRLKVASQGSADELWILDGAEHTTGVLLNCVRCEPDTPISSPFRSAYLRKIVEFSKQHLR